MAAAPVRLRLLGTSDLHMAIEDHDYYAARQDHSVGLARLSTVIVGARAECANCLLFDNGDILQGNPLGDYMALPGRLAPARDGTGGHPMFRAMNLLGYDAATFGNHEFNYGLEFLREALRSAAFPFCCANLETVSGEAFVPPSLVLHRQVTDEAGATHGLRIGVIGFVPPQIMIWDRSRLEGRVRTLGIVEAARRHVPALRARCDLVVALSHSGISSGARPGGEENASLHLARVPGIDVLFTGHSHLVFPGPHHASADLPEGGIDPRRGTLAGKPAVMPGFAGSHVGIIDLVLERDAGGAWRVSGFSVEARPSFRREGREAVPLAANDPRVLQAGAAEHASTLLWMEQPVGYATRPITSYLALVENDVSLSLVNAAQLWYARPLLAAGPCAALPVLSAASPFKAGGARPDAFIDIAAGALAMRDIAALAMFANTVCAVRCSGEEIREWLERACSVFNRIDPSRSAPQELLAAGAPSYVFDVISGLTYGIDLSQPARYGVDGTLRNPTARRIVGLRHAGAPIDPRQDFVVVTNNYRADGGGSFPGTGSERIVLSAPDLTRDVLVRYVMQHQPLTPAAEPVWHFAGLDGPVLLVFRGNAETARHVAARPDISRLGEDADGFVRYGISVSGARVRDDDVCA